MEKLEFYIHKGILVKMPGIENLVSNFLKKARTNLITMSILLETKRKEVKDLLNIPRDYSPNEWVINTAYYSMYLAALAALAKIGYKSKNHTATIYALETFFVKKGLLEKEILELLEKVKIESKYVEMIRTARDKREIAQYSPTKKTVDFAATSIKGDSYKFVNRIEKLIYEIDRKE